MSTGNVWFVRVCMGLTWMVLSYAGNTMIILVMTSSKSQPRAKTTRLLFCVLAVADMCSVTCSFIFEVQQLFMMVVGYEWLFPFILVFFETSSEFSIWTLVVISLERFVCVFCPCQVKRYCNFKLLRASLVLILFCSFVGNMLIREISNLDFMYEFIFKSIVNVAIPILVDTSKYTTL